MEEKTESQNHPKENKKIDLNNPKNRFDLIYQSKNLDDIKTPITDHLENIINKSRMLEKYKIIFLYDPENQIRDYTADQIYKSLPKKEENKDILLILHSSGGSIEPAYLISKCCKSCSNNFAVVVPRRAKSAATLIVLGANEIHMGQMSQLGPIDPQIGKLPALGLGNAVEYLAKLCNEHPNSSSMLAQYLSNKLDLRILGFMERVSESAQQYAERLLDNKNLPNTTSIKQVAHDLVYSYKDHSFVIDKDEAKKHLGGYIKEGTDEYRLGDDINRFLEEIQILVQVLKKKNLSIIGNFKNISFFDVEESD